MNKYTYIIGIDTSKHQLDLHIISPQGKEEALRIENSSQGMRAFQEAIQSFEQEHILICVEHTGIYNAFLMHFCSENNLDLWVENALHIKQSQGLQRGKNDQVDAKRIAQYAQRYQDQARLWQANHQILSLLKHLIAAKNRLVTVQAQITTPLKELKSYLKEEDYQEIINPQNQVICALKASINQIEDKIKELLKQDPALQKMMKRLTSVPGIGRNTAMALILYTKAFTRIQTARQCACYAGIVVTTNVPPCEAGIKIAAFGQKA